jgi:hypothetical protein
MAQERVHIVDIHRQRVPLAMKQNVSPDPRYISLFGSITVMAPSQREPNLIEKPRLGNFFAHKRIIPRLCRAQNNLRRVDLEQNERRDAASADR